MGLRIGLQAGTSPGVRRQFDNGARAERMQQIASRDAMGRRLDGAVDGRLLLRCTEMGDPSLVKGKQPLGTEPNLLGCLVTSSFSASV